VAKAKRRPADHVTRREFTALAGKVEECANNLEVQFKRIAQIQAELDRIRAAWARSKPPRRAP
jgi:uncharacterized protein YukE